MKQGRLLSTILLILLSLSLSIMCGCSSNTSGGGDSGTAVADKLSALGVTATPATINLNETSTIKVTAYDASGNTISRAGIVFTLSDPTIASIASSTVTTDENGIAEVVLTARDTSGSVTVTATAGSVSRTATVTISGGGVVTGVAVAALDITATPDVIPPDETTTVEAIAYDAQGNVITGVDVVFTLDDPKLAYITSTATTDNNGVAEATLTARNRGGEVNVTAKAENVTSDAPATVTILDGTAPDTINLTVTPASVVALGTVNVQAEVLDLNGDPVSDGTTVSFKSNNTIYGTFASQTATTTNGFATATFEAANVQGTASITAQSGGISAQAEIVVYPAEATSVEFVSASPQRIAIQGSGGVETSVIQFIVKDSNGNPVKDEKVSFSMNNLSGGEKIDASGDSTPQQIDVSSNADGIAQVILNSGTVAGPITIQATITVDSQNITSKSSVISIGGGVASAKRFSVSLSTFNLPGLAYNNRTTEITAYLADRFGNYNILDGTSVSYMTESGLTILSSEVTANEQGVATSTARTQGPSLPDFAGPEDVLPASWETSLINYINANYPFYGGSLPSGNPRDGLSSVLVVVKGEEYFEDDNGNGAYDTGEVFIDSFDDPFVDSNDNNQHESSASADPFEEYIDSGQNGVWDGNNGVWDSDKNIFASAKVLITGGPIILSDTGDGFNVANAGHLDFNVIVCDRNLNILSGGTTVSISTDAGKLRGRIDETIGDTNSVGPDMATQLSAINYAFSLEDSNPDQTKTETSVITVSVTWEGLVTSYTITGTVN